MINIKRQGKHSIILVVSVACLFVCAALFFISLEYEKSKLKYIFKELCDYRFKYVEDALQDSVSALVSFSDFYASSKEINKDEFNIFAQGIYSRQPYIYEFRWLPRVTSGQRVKFEEWASKEIFPNFKIRELDKSQALIPAFDRPEYFPITYISYSPRVKLDNSQIFGLDSLSIPERWQAMEIARDSASTAITGEVKQYGDANVPTASRIFIPIFRNGLPHDNKLQRKENLIGFVALLYRIDELVKKSFAGMVPKDMDFAIYDASSSPKRLLYLYSSRSPISLSDYDKLNPKHYLNYSSTIKAVNHKWLLVASPTNEFLASHRIILSWVVLSAGLVLALMLIFNLTTILRREEAVESQVKQRTEQLRISEERFRQLFESSRDAIMVLDRQGFVNCNDKTLELFGVKEKKDFIKKHPSEFSPPYQSDGKDSLAASLMHIEQAFKRGSDFFEWTHKKLDGTVFPAEVLLSKFRLGDEEYLQATVRDIAERKRIEEQLELAVKEWERTFNSIADFIFIQDKDYHILRVNNAFAQVMKIKPEDIIGKKCYQVMHNLDHPWPSCPFEKSKIDHIAHSEEVDDPNIGIPLLVSVSPIFDANGKFAGAVHIAKDISERKKIENALREAVELKTNFTSTVSHELRTPLASIKEGITIVLDGSAGTINKEQGEFLGIAKKNVDRLARLINNILDFQKLDADKMDFNMRFNDINEVINEVREAMLSVAKQKNLNLILRLEGEIHPLQFDRDRIIQVLTNLINNAIKFTEKGSITISANREKEFLKVSVKDTGIGIKEEDVPSLFEKFKQLDTGLGRKTGGTGLGLSICKEIINKHKGKIWVESKIGLGSTFSFTLPIA